MHVSAASPISAAGAAVPRAHSPTAEQGMKTEEEAAPPDRHTDGFNQSSGGDAMSHKKVENPLSISNKNYKDQFNALL